MLLIFAIKQELFKKNIVSLWKQCVLLFLFEGADVKIEQMRLFAEVVKHGSYTQAADKLGVSKGYLSKQIKQLEQALGKPLLVRNTRVMRLTSAGEVLFKEATKLTTFWVKTKLLLDQAEEQLSGQVKCTAPVGIAHYILSPLFRSLINQQPDIRLLIDSGNNTHNLVADDFDFAIRITNTPPEDMVAIPLTQINYICCATPSFLAKQQAIQSPGDLQHMDCLVLSHWHQWTFEGKSVPATITPRGKFVATDNELLKQACINHLGVARLPEYMIKEELAQGGLVNLFPTINGDHRDLYLIYPQLSTRPKRVLMFLTAIREYFSENND